MVEVVTKDVVVTRVCDASPKRVWKAWTEDAAGQYRRLDAMLADYQT